VVGRAKARTSTQAAAAASRTTTVRVRASTKLIIERMAKAEGSTHDEVMSRMARHERQRMIGAELAQRELTADDDAVVRASADAVVRASR
jgi:hypothetical protein